MCASRIAHEIGRHAVAWPALVLGFCAASASASEAAAPNATGPEPVRERAVRLYQQGEFDEACALYERLVAEARTDGARWADLGLCEYRRGHTDAGHRASLLAVRYGDEATRKHAYFNLHAAGHRVHLPEQKPGGGTSCELLQFAAPFACETKLWACIVPWTQYGSGGGTAGTAVIFGSKPEDMEYWKALMPFERPQAASAAGAVQLSWEEEKLCGFCETHAWDCARSAIVTPKVEQCFQRRAGTRREFDPSMCFRRTPAEARLCDAYMKCHDELCKQAQASYEQGRPSWPEAAAEIARAHQACADCGLQRSRTCEVIAVDPCAGRIGYACRQTGRGAEPQLDLAEVTVGAVDEAP